MSTLAVRAQTVLIRQFEVTITEGPDQGARVRSQGDEL